MKKLVAWVEIPAIHFEKTVDFYSTVFDVKFDVMDYGKEQMACFPSGEGAISKSPGFLPSSDGVLVSFVTEAISASLLDKVKEKGGEVVVGKTKIEAEGRGYFAIIKDCEGNKIGLYEN